MPQIFTLPKQVVIDPLTGNPAPGAKAYFYETGTSTPKPVYSDAALTTAISQPVVADSAGVLQVVYYSPDGQYKLTLNRSDDTLIYSVDPLNNSVFSFENNDIVYPRTATEIAAGVTPSNFYLPTFDTQPGSIKRVGAVMDGVTDDSAALVEACLTEETIFLPEGDLYINSVVTVPSNIIGCGDTGTGTAGKTTITLGPSGQLVVGNWWCHWRGFVIRSASNNKVFIKCAQSYFTMTDYRAERMSAATGQSLIEFDCSANSVYFATLERFKHKVDRPVLVTGTSSYVFNANKIGGSLRDYWQDFVNAIAISGVVTADANQFAGYFETGTNMLNLDVSQFKQNKLNYVLDGVTRDLNTSTAVTVANEWNRLDGGAFTVATSGAGAYPTNQVFVGIPQTRVRATQATAQAMTNAAATTVTYDTEVFDALSEFVPGTGVFTCKQPGYIKVSGGARSASVAWDAGERWEARIYKNGTEYASGNYDRADAAITVSRSSYVEALISVAVGDTVDLRIIHNQGGSVNLDTAPTANFIEIERVVS